MKKITFTVFFIFLGLLTFAQQNDKYIYHRVKAGETEYGIAHQYNISIEELEKYNPDIKNGLHENFLLLIPKTKDGHKIHLVTQGETLYSIARDNEVSIAELKAANPELKDGLKAGQQLIIPEAEAKTEHLNRPADTVKEDANFIYHTVKPGETLFSLASDHGTSVSEIIAANPEIKDGLKANMTIKIPKPKSIKRNVVQQTQPQSRNFTFHEVKKDETAYSLSREYKITLDSLFALNPGAENGLKIGQMLKLPELEKPDSTVISAKGPKDELNGDDTTATAQSDTSNGFFLYQIKSGDSFYSLKNRFNVDHDELVEYNPEVAKGLVVNKYIIIPVKGENTSEDVTWLQKLFGEEQEAKNRSGNPAQGSIKRKDSLNNPEAYNKLGKPVFADTLDINTSKNYKVALMLPFNIVSDTSFSPANDVTKIVLDFYNGFLLAADTLSKQGMNITLNVMDTHNDIYRLQNRIPEIEQSHYDLIVGPLYQKNVEYIADQLQRDSVPVISPLSNAVDITNRPNLIKCTPDLGATAQQIANLINTKYANARIIFAHSGNDHDREQVKQIKARLLPRSNGSYIDNMLYDQDDEVISRTRISSMLAEDKPNVVIVISDDPVFLSDLVSKLRVMSSRDITLIGPPKLMQIPTLELDYLNTLHLTMPDANFVNYDSPEVNAFIKAYRDKYNDEPSRFAFQGYDVGMYFLQKLWTTGPYFLRAINNENQPMLGTGFKIRKSDNGGFENDFMFLTGVRNLTLMKVDK